jgi:hypothetical protein
MTARQFNNSTAKPPHWYAKWDARALAEGWLLSADDRIERDDDAPPGGRRFSSDNAALAHVKREARKGSLMHQTALWYHEASAAGYAPEKRA